MPLQRLIETLEHFIKLFTGNKILAGNMQIGERHKWRERDNEKGKSTNGIILRKLLPHCWRHTPGERDMRVKVASSSGTE